MGKKDTKQPEHIIALEPVEKYQVSAHNYVTLHLDLGDYARMNFPVTLTKEESLDLSAQLAEAAAALP